ncbi:MAG TPA: alginate lyase family protein [Gammaproteobacteria bacterium]|nr:alginate lyase family protein [Gammaproteobacteria bacterium]
MKPSELVIRAGQELAKRLERNGLLGGLRPLSVPDYNAEIAEGREARQPRARRPETLFRRWSSSVETRFFDGAMSARARAVLENRMPEERAQLLSSADDICRGRFDLLGYRQLCFGDPIDWHFDPVSGRRAPRLHWSRLDPLDAETVGDSKVIWELNRHQWAVTLGQAYRYTDDERYADRFAAYIKEWMQANPPGTGINWASSLELSLRLIAWSWALFLFRGSRVLTPEFYVEMLEWIRAQARHVERYLSYYFSPNTHLTGEALGLFYVGVMFPELEGAARWRRLGRRILLDQLERQVLDDGVYFEQATCYQRYTVDIYLHFMILAARQGEPVPASTAARVRKMLDFLLAVSGPDGALPQIGDGDGGTLLPLSRRAPGDYHSVFGPAAVLFRSSEYAWAARTAAPEVVWLLGVDGLRVFDSLPPDPPSAAVSSRLFPDGGYTVMRSGWDRSAHRLIFDVGPHGCPVSGGHGHADLLSVQCSLFGEPYLVDAGTCVYTADAQWRDYFRGTASHNTVTVDGLEQALPTGPFKWRERRRARLRRWISTEAMDLADADHDAYRRLPDPVTHRRRVLFVKPRYYVIVDDLEGAAEHRIDLRFQFAPMEVTLNPDSWVLAADSTGRECRMLVTATAPLRTELVRGRTDPPQGWVAPDYGCREPAPMLVCSTTAQLPLRIVTLLFPMDSLFSLPPAVDAGPEHRHIDLAFEHGLETLHISEQNIVVERKPSAARRTPH